MCLWDPSRVDLTGLDRYLDAADAACARVGVPPICVAGGSIRYSIEQALCTLVNKFDYDTGAAVRALDSMETIDAVREAVLPPKEDDWRWSDGDRRLFEYAYRHHGSDFNAIADFMTPEKSVAQVQRFYYTWKRSLNYYNAIYRPVKRQRRATTTTSESTSQQNSLQASSTASSTSTSGQKEDKMQ